MIWSDKTLFALKRSNAELIVANAVKGKVDFFFFSIPSLFFFDLKHFFINCAFQNKIAEFCCRWCNKDIFFQNLSYLCQFAGRLQNDPNTCSGHHHFVLDLLEKIVITLLMGQLPSHLNSIPRVIEEKTCYSLIISDSFGRRRKA